MARARFPHEDMPDTAFPDTVIAARVRPGRGDPSFLEWLWNGPFVRAQVESRARTTNGTFKVNQSMLEEMQLLAPPAPSQVAFGSRASHLRELERSLGRSLERLDALFASLQYRAFRGEL